MGGEPLVVEIGLSLGSIGKQRGDHRQRREQFCSDQQGKDPAQQEHEQHSDEVHQADSFMVESEHPGRNGIGHCQIAGTGLIDCGRCRSSFHLIGIGTAIDIRLTHISFPSGDSRSLRSSGSVT